MNPAHINRRDGIRTWSRVGAVVILLGLSLGASATDLYRWTDSRGIVHYTDKPPRGVNAERVQTKPPRPLTSSGRESEETAPEVNDPNAERCKAEKERLSILQSNRKIQMENRDGSLKELSAEEIQQEIQVSQRAVDRFCKPADNAEE